MELVRLTAAIPVGHILDALEYFPELFIASQRSVAAQSVAIVTVESVDERAVFLLGRQAVAQGADVLIVVGSTSNFVHSRGALLPIIVVSEGTSVEEIASRLRGLDTDALSPRLLAEERARASVLDIVDGAAALLGGHIIVEDESFKMLAYSQLSAPVDEARQNAILHRQMPAYLERTFNSQGVQASLLGGQDIVFVAPDYGVGLGPRLVVAVRHRGRLVGTIWFARAVPEFSDRDVTELSSAAEQMSVILAGSLRMREDDQIRYDDAALDLLHGRRVGAALEVLAEQIPRLQDGAHVMSFAQVVPNRQESSARLADFRALVSSAVRSVSTEAINVPEGDRLHVIHFGCEESAEDCGAAKARLISEQMSASLVTVNIVVAVGLGRHVDHPRDVVDSAQSAERVLAGLLKEGHAEIASARESWAPLLLDSFLSVPQVRHDLLPVGARLLLHSGAEKDRELVSTVRASLDFWGDIGGVAQYLHVHHNTVRYRLQCFADRTGIDLGDPVKRLALWMLLTHLEAVDGPEGVF